MGAAWGGALPAGGVSWGRRGALTKVHLLVALGALRHGGWRSGADVWAGTDRRAGLGGSGRVRAFQGPQDPAPLRPALRDPPPESEIWTQGPGFQANQLRKVLWSTPTFGLHPGLADYRAGVGWGRAACPGSARDPWGCTEGAGLLRGLQPRHSPKVQDLGKGLPRARMALPSPSPSPPARARAPRYLGAREGASHR